MFPNADVVINDDADSGEYEPLYPLDIGVDEPPDENEVGFGVPLYPYCGLDAMNAALPEAIEGYDFGAI